jgi:lipopolysaccharide biosynthesis protein
VRVCADEAALEPASALSLFKARLSPYAQAALRFGPLTMRPDGASASARDYRKLLKFARGAGLAFDGEALMRRPELILGWPPAPRASAAPRPGPRLAVALHLHYGELWPEIAGRLHGWARPFTLLVSLTREDEALRRSILADFPDAEIDVVENKGRDVRPFLLWLESGRLDRFDLVCKIHGKRSRRQGAPPLFGELFRRAALLDLIDPASIEPILARFAAAPRLGLVGPERFRAVSRHGDPAEIMGASRGAIESLATRMGAKIERDYDAFHGTMFWARPEALRALRDLGLAQEGFHAEAGRDDGGLEHAVEGLVNLAVRASGFSTEGTRAP